MTKVIVALICMTVVLTLTMSASTRRSDTVMNAGTTEPMTTERYQDIKSNEDNDLDMQQMMNDCNETFRIEMAYLESLNYSGSFPDETDMTPKCFFRCMLENLKIMSSEDGKLNSARAAVIFAGERNGKPMEDIGGITALCADRREENACERAYKFMRCLMSIEIEKYETS